jgi:dihydropteroate synthase
MPRTHELPAAVGQPQLPLVMGILNCSPDSFSDGGLASDACAAAERLADLCREGADIIDIGGESTAPDRFPISAALEVSRIEAAVARAASSAFVSVDTYHAATAKRCLELGARMINDISALRADPDMTAVVAEHRAFVVLMHAKDGPLPHASRTPREYTDVIATIRDFLSRRIEHACSAGIDPKRIVLDPGMGLFLSPDPRYSFEVLSRFAELADYFSEFPLLIGTSRKGFLGGSLAERDPISQLTALYAVERGAAVIRTHNVRMARAFLEARDRCAPPGAV